MSDPNTNSAGQQVNILLASFSFQISAYSRNIFLKQLGEHDIMLQAFVGCPEGGAMAKLSWGNGSQKEHFPEVGRKRVKEEPQQKVNQTATVGDDVGGLALRRGETLRKDGFYMYRPTKDDYDGPEAGRAVYAKTIPELRIKEARLLESLQKRRPIIANNCTLNGLYDVWSKLKRGVRSSTMSNYAYTYEHFVKNTALGRTLISRIKKSDIVDFYNDLVERQSIQINTISNIHGVLSQVFQVAVDDQILVFNPTTKAMNELRRQDMLDHPDAQTELPALTLAEQYILLDYLNNHEEKARWRRIILTLLGGGERVGELAGMQWEDIDFDTGIIQVRHNLVYFAHSSSDYKCSFELHPPKTRAGCRELPMLNFVSDALREERKWQTDTGKHCKTVVDGYSDFVFFNRFENAFAKGSINGAIKRIIKDCNAERIEKYGHDCILLPEFTVHTLRRTCATRLIENGVSPIAVQRFLGHSNINVTMKVYVTCTEYFKRQEFGLSDAEKYPDIFSVALGRAKKRQETAADIIKKYLPPQANGELEELTQNYTATTQKPCVEDVDFDDLYDE